MVISVFICLCIYTLTGVFGYLTFSTRETGCIASDILQSYCPHMMIDVARALMGVIMVTSYPILTFCGRLENSLLYLAVWWSAFATCQIKIHQYFVLTLEYLQY